MKRFIKRTIGLFIIVTLIFSMLPSVTFAVDKPKTVKVGYIDYHGFIDRSGDGYTGYGVEYLDEISKYTGWKYEYVYGSWTDIMEKVKNGEIDFICTAQYTEERGRYYDFSDYPIGYTQGVIYARADDTSMYYDDYRAMDGSVVGVLAGNAMNELFYDYAELHGISYTTREYYDTDELKSGLSEGKVNVAVTESLGYQDELKLVGNLGADAFYIISYKNSPLMKDLNTALRLIKTDTYFEADLYDKYFGDSTAEKDLQLTREEAEYIKDSGTIQVALQSNRFPLAYMDEDSKELKGIYIAAMDQISKMSGLNFHYIPVNGVVPAADYLKNTDAKLFAGLYSSNTKEFSSDLMTSQSFMPSTITMVGRSGSNIDTNGEFVIAIPEGYTRGEGEISKLYPKAEFKKYCTSDDCLYAVRDGEADFMMQDNYVSTALLQNPRFDELAIFNAYNISRSTVIAMLKTGDSKLMSIINKCINKIDKQQFADSITSYTTGRPYKLTITDMFYENKVSITIVFSLLLLLVISFVMYTISRQKHMRTLEKKNDQLGEAIAQANEANASKSRFLSQMSHEIRTPMNAIIGLTTIALQETDKPDNVRDYLKKIEESSKILLGIINEILDMSAIENQKLKIAQEEFNFKKLLTSITNVFYQQCREKGIEYEMKLVGDIEENLIGDELRVNQILMNLVSNAVKFTPSEGRITIDIMQTRRVDNQIIMCITVADTGCGMTSEMLTRLFKPFEQESTATIKSHGGSGLGLSITKNLVDLMHGSISVESEKDKGTVFTVNLPFGIGKKTNELSQRELEDIRVIVVDDDQDELKYASGVLQRLGIEFDCASTGEEALILLGKADGENHPYNICIVDWRMPGMDGGELTRKIREIFKDDSTIIIASAYDLNEIEEEGMAAGANYFVSKPLFQSTVFDILQKINGGRLSDITEAKEISYDFTGHRVLVAEDISLNMEVARKLLERVGIEVEEAENGKVAVEKFENSAEGTYNAILMDIHMPVMDGFEATHHIRNSKHPQSKKIPICAMTANAFTEDITACINAGMNGHIAKPIDVEDLYDTLSYAFKWKGGK